MHADDRDILNTVATILRHAQPDFAEEAMADPTFFNRPRRRTRARPRNRKEHLVIEDDDEHAYEHE